MTAAIDVGDILSRLTVAEKVSLLSGRDWWHTVALPEHGVPSIRVSDGPNGVRGTAFFNGVKAACFPCGTAMGATWDVELLRKAGVVMGQEAKAKGAHVILGPTINMQRSALGGRGFESFSEDPVLAGLGAAALVNGMKDENIVATIKHFVCNDLEHERNGTDAILTERALREIYALPFQLVVKESNPGCFMTAYNKVNGTHVSENPKLLKELLREEWGWDGCVMSDWWGTYSTTGAMNAGLDLEMPGGTKFRGSLVNHAISAKKITTKVLDERARNVLNLVNRCSKANIPENAPETTADTPETAAFLRKFGADSIVLLKNEGDILPLKKDKKTLIMGPNAKLAAYHGGGSASLAAYYAVTPFDGISAQLTSPPDFIDGCYAHKELPLLGNFLKTDKGETGITLKVYAEPPTVENRKPVDELVLQKTELLMMDYNPPGLKDPLWYGQIDANYECSEDCDFELGVGVYGTAKLFVDGKLVIDNDTVQRQGTMFFNCGTVEETGIAPMKKGQTYHIKIEFASAPSSRLRGGSALSGGGAIRLGGAKIIDADKEVQRAAALAKEADQVIICAGLNADWEGEGSDRESMALPGHMDKIPVRLLDKTASAAYDLLQTDPLRTPSNLNQELIAAVSAANPSTVVVTNSGTPYEMPWISSVNALVHAWYGGNETGNAIADVLFGDVNPSGKLPLSFPKRNQDNPAFLNYRTEAGRTLYGEDVYIGYRWFEMLDMPVLFPFGHGLSYTKFSFSGLKVTTDEKNLTVHATVSNIGKKAGAEVAQVYVSQKNPSIRRPKKELKGFTKVWLEAGESKEVSVTVELKYATSFWDEVNDSWISEKDSYSVIVGGSSDTSDALTGGFEIAKTTWWKGL